MRKGERMSDQINPRVFGAIVAALKRCRLHPDIDLGIEKASTTTIESLQLDSLDLLQFAMDVEDDLGIEIDVVEFPPGATLAEVVEHIEHVHIK
jgi:acyl carrier protein